MKRLLVYSIAVVILASSIFTLYVSLQSRSASAEEQMNAQQFRRGGFIPPDMDLSHLRRTREYLPKTMMQPPASWDWRSLGGLTPVKNQGIYSTCWAFAAIGDIESKLLINWGQSRDFSEHNVVACAPNQFYLTEGTSCFTGGNAYISTSYLSRLGTVDETCDEYPGHCPSITCMNPNCYFRRQVTEWQVIVGDIVEPGDITLIKEAIMNYGPVYTAMYSQWAEFQSYDTDTCLTYSGTENTDHAVLIVGWDDTMCGGSGAWIVKNSWGSGWGDSGYFYIRYGDAKIGSYTSVITDTKYFDEMEKIYFYDDYGFTGAYGWSDGDDWGMVAVTPSWSGDLNAVDFWATSAPTTYTIYVYDDFDGTNLSNPLAGPVSGTVTGSGYYSIELPSPPPASMSDPIYIAVNFQTPGYDYPIPIDTKSPRETNKCYVSSLGTDFYALDAGNWNVADVGIRGRVEPHCNFIFPQLDIEFIGTERIMMGMNEGIRYFIEVVNRNTVDDVLFEDAPDLWPYTAENSRSWIEIMDANDYRLLNTMSELESSDEMDSLYFDNVRGLPTPDSVVIGLKDKRCFVSYGSDVTPLSTPSCGQTNLSIAAYRKISFTDSLWEIQIAVENLGPGKAYELAGTMSSGEPWLTILNGDCTYGDLAEGAISFGMDTYILDMHGYPGGLFDVWIDFNYEDICFDPYATGNGTTLDPDITEDEVPPVTAFALVQNYPNPFNPNTTIKYEIASGCHVKLRIYDVTGRLIKVLEERHRERGRYSTEWDGRDGAGRTVASGIYFYRLQAGDYAETKRMVLIR